MELVPQLIASGLTVGAVYALIALGFTIIFSATGILNFAQGEFVMLGALVGVTVYTKLGIPYLISLVLTVVSVTIVGILFDKLVVESLVRAKSPLFGLIVSTVAVSFLLRNGSAAIWGTTQLYAKPVLGNTPIVIFDASFIPQSFVVFAVTIVALLATWYFYDRTIIGRSFRAVAINREAAGLIGADADMAILCSFAISAALGGAAGLAFSPISNATAYMGALLGIKGFAASLLGGLGNMAGAVAGGLILGLLEAFGAAYLPTGYQDAISFTIMLFILFVRPSGLFSRGRSATRV